MVSQLKNRMFILIILTLVSFVFIQADVIEAKQVETKAKTAIIVDADTGKVLYAKDADEPLPPASMTKMMTQYIVLDKIANGELDWKDTTEISDYAYWISSNNKFSGLGLTQDKDYTVESLYEAMVIYSDNGTTVALAEMISDSEGEFVKLMNEKAEELGMDHTEFYNSSGIDNNTLDGRHPEGTKKDDSNLMSAHDSALLAYHIVKDYPEALETSSKPKSVFDDHDITNYNWMLKHDTEYLKEFYYEGVDGLKTGHTDLAGYTFTGTAERDGQRLIVVVMKTKSEAARFKETAVLLDYGFDEFKETEVFPGNYQLEDESTLPVDKGKENSVQIATEEAFSIPILKGTEKDYKVAYKVDKDLLNDAGELTAPIKKGEKVGIAELVFDEGEDFGYILNSEKKPTVDLIATEDVEKKNWFSLMLSAIGQFFVGLFDKIKGLF